MTSHSPRDLDFLREGTAHWCGLAQLDPEGPETKAIVTFAVGPYSLSC